MKVVGLLVARLGSTRLPRKALKPLLGKPMVERLAERALKAKSLDALAVATTTLPEDAELCAWAKGLGLGGFRGDPENVSLRMSQAASALGADVVVEMLVDNPLIHHEQIDAVVGLLKKGGLDYAATVTKEYPAEAKRALFPLGVRVQAYTRTAADAWSDYPQLLGGPQGTTAFLFGNPQRFKLGFVEASGPWAACRRPDWNFAVNYQKNFELAERAFRELGAEADLPRLCAWAEKDPAALALMGAPS